MEDVVVTLRNDLGKEEFVVGNPENIKQLSELINSEIQALLQVGIDLRRYPSGGVDKTDHIMQCYLRDKTTI